MGRYCKLWEICVKVWESMGKYWKVWEDMRMYGNVWKIMGKYGNV